MEFQAFPFFSPRHYLQKISAHFFQIEGIESPHDLMSAKFGTYGEVNSGWEGSDVRGFAKMLSNAQFENSSAEELSATFFYHGERRWRTSVSRRTTMAYRRWRTSLCIATNDPFTTEKEHKDLLFYLLGSYHFTYNKSTHRKKSLSKHKS